jgi:hypothetical protein
VVHVRQAPLDGGRAGVFMRRDRSYGELVDPLVHVRSGVLADSVVDERLIRRRRRVKFHTRGAANVGPTRFR